MLKLKITQKEKVNRSVNVSGIRVFFKVFKTNLFFTLRTMNSAIIISTVSSIGIFFLLPAICLIEYFFFGYKKKKRIQRN